MKNSPDSKKKVSKEDMDKMETKGDLINKKDENEDIVKFLKAMQMKNKWTKSRKEMTR